MQNNRAMPNTGKTIVALIITGLTDIGYSRDHNEDAIAWDEDRNLALLADGMGGHLAGDVASQLCLDTLLEYLQPALDKPLSLKPNKGVTKQATLMRRAVNHANKAVFEAASANPEYQGMGTTVAALLFYDKRLVVAHVGDSRVYRLRNGSLEPITRDHSLVREMLDHGVISPEEAVDNPYSHVITKAVGVQENVVAEVQEYPVREGDIYLLCSDGLTDMVDDNDIEAILIEADGDMDSAARALVDRANEHGGRDNISVVLTAVD